MRITGSDVVVVTGTVVEVVAPVVVGREPPATVVAVDIVEVFEATEVLDVALVGKCDVDEGLAPPPGKAGPAALALALL